MNQCKPALLAVFLLTTLFANAATKNTIRVKVVDSATRTITTDDNGAPRNCDLSNYDAYCHGSTEGEVINVLLVQEGNAPPYRVRCVNDSKWSKSRCALLPKGETFDAIKEKNGITVFYPDDNGKIQKQLYTYVAKDENGKPMAPQETGETQASPAAAGSAAESSSAASVGGSSLQPVKCSFSSTPSGADITLDGQYVGSTPSVLDVSAGKHVVAVTMPGFEQWKRDLTVSPGSELTVNAVLQKAQ